MMLITNIIEYFRSLANRHNRIECFRTGESAELNETQLSYPLLFLNTDFTTSYSSNAGLIDGEYVFISFRLETLVASREAYDAKPENQIKMIGESVKQDQDLALAHKILTEVVGKATIDFNEDFLNGWMLVDELGGVALKRVANDDCDGWTVTLTLKVHNQDFCDLDSAFGDDVIDKGVNKTQYQKPTNVSPIQRTIND